MKLTLFALVLGITVAIPSSSASEKFSDAEKMFQRVKAELLTKYYRNVSEEDLYRAAIKGMLENIDPAMAEWNTLLTPTDLRELKTDLEGEIVGAGLEIKFDRDSGITDVQYVIPDSPSSGAGVLAGDKILNVDGKFYKGKELRDVVYDIRGKVGESRKLTLLRGDKLLHKTVRLSKIPYADVTFSVLPGEIGLIGLSYFAQKTPVSLRAAVEKLSKQKVRGIVLDLRGNSGGIFDKAVESAEVFLPKGKTIVRVVGRSGEEEIILSQKDPVLGNIPVTVLTNQETKSGAEFVAAALRDNLSAPVIGSHTFGKWSVQRIDELPNQYAAKYTVSLFKSPSGNSFGGKGLEPDIAVAFEISETAKVQRLAEPSQKVARDPQLRAAVNLLKSRI